MGLALEVGMLADLFAQDEEGAQFFQEDMAKVNGVLAIAGLPPHAEPRECAVHSTGMYGYSGLHHLRRIAAHLHYGRGLPSPLAENAKVTDDNLLTRYGADFVAENIEATPGCFALSSSREFDHLIMHSDAEGFYLPLSFDQVLISGDQAYGWIGSSYALRNECQKLAEALELPPELLSDPESETLHEPIGRGGDKSSKWRLFGKNPAKRPWQQHPIAALSCAKLYSFANYSIQSKAALVFC